MNFRTSLSLKIAKRWLRESITSNTLDSLPPSSCPLFWLFDFQFDIVASMLCKVRANLTSIDESSEGKDCNPESAASFFR